MLELFAVSVALGHVFDVLGALLLAFPLTFSGNAGRQELMKVTTPLPKPHVKPHPIASYPIILYILFQYTTKKPSCPVGSPDFS